MMYAKFRRSHLFEAKKKNNLFVAFRHSSLYSDFRHNFISRPEIRLFFRMVSA